MKINWKAAGEIGLGLAGVVLGVGEIVLNVKDLIDRRRADSELDQDHELLISDGVDDLREDPPED